MSSPRSKISSTLPEDQPGCALQGGHCNVFHSQEQNRAHKDHSHDEHDHAHDHSHDHSHGHSHGHFSEGDLTKIGFKLQVSTAVTILFVIGELIAGIYAGSLALISDAAHNFTDAL